LGAVCRMEADGRDPEEIRRFKQALRGPLGGLGDQLVWVGWRPATVLGAVALALAGAPPLVTVVFFLVFYNLGHLLLRVWGFRVGLEWGSQVGDSMRAANLPRRADRLAGWAVFLLGGVVGLAFSRVLGNQSLPLLLLCATGGVWAIWLGSLVGQRGWRWTYWGVTATIGVLFLVGWFG
jgi:PTS system mannose-specific IID component